MFYHPARRCWRCAHDVPTVSSPILIRLHTLITTATSTDLLTAKFKPTTALETTVAAILASSTTATTAGTDLTAGDALTLDGQALNHAEP